MHIWQCRQPQSSPQDHWMKEKICGKLAGMEKAWKVGRNGKSINYTRRQKSEFKCPILLQANSRLQRSLFFSLNKCELLTAYQLKYHGYTHMKMLPIWKVISCPCCSIPLATNKPSPGEDKRTLIFIRQLHAFICWSCHQHAIHL